MQGKARALEESAARVALCISTEIPSPAAMAAALSVWSLLVSPVTPKNVATSLKLNVLSSLNTALHSRYV